jgi:hypothetical protein
MDKWLRHSLLVAAGGLSLAGLNPAIAADWSEQDLLDGQCVAFYAADLGNSDSENPDPGLMALVGYFVGKIEGRNPGFDLIALLSPEFMTNAQLSWTAIGARCAVEGAKFGESLTSAGETLENRDGS